MRSSFVFALAALCVTCAAAQRISGGGCPNVTVKSDFDVSKYTGLWYNFASIPSSFEPGLKCSTATYENKGDYISILNKGIQVDTGKKQSIEGKATIPDVKVPAKLEIEFDGIPLKGKYWVLDTDYENYSLVYSCSSLLNLFKTEFLWILSRQPTLDDAKLEKVYKVLEVNGVSKEDIKPQVQDCA